MLGRHDREPLAEADHAILRARSRREGIGWPAHVQPERDADHGRLAARQVGQRDAQVDRRRPLPHHFVAVDRDRVVHRQEAQRSRHDGQVDVVDRAGRAVRDLELLDRVKARRTDVQRGRDAVCLIEPRGRGRARRGGRRKQEPRHEQRDDERETAAGGHPSMLPKPYRTVILPPHPHEPPHPSSLADRRPRAHHPLRDRFRCRQRERPGNGRALRPMGRPDRELHRSSARSLNDPNGRHHPRANGLSHARPDAGSVVHALPVTHAARARAGGRRGRRRPRGRLHVAADGEGLCRRWHPDGAHHPGAGRQLDRRSSRRSRTASASGSRSTTV